MSFTMRPCWRWLLLFTGLTLAACATGGPKGLKKGLVKDAEGDELRKETTVGVTLPPGCPPITTSVSAEKKKMTVSYQEPTANLSGPPLQLLFTTVYLSSPEGQGQAIRVWTNDARGGAIVTVKNVAVPAQEFSLCVTATNWGRQESAPAIPTQ